MGASIYSRAGTDAHVVFSADRADSETQLIKKRLFFVRELSEVQRECAEAVAVVGSDPVLRCSPGSCSAYHCLHAGLCF